MELVNQSTLKWCKEISYKYNFLSQYNCKGRKGKQYMFIHIFKNSITVYESLFFNLRGKNKGQNIK